jgi:exopolysaccharide biosynthesis polyprenyl glycosylphosphotransferase
VAGSRFRALGRPNSFMSKTGEATLQTNPLGSSFDSTARGQADQWQGKFKRRGPLRTLLVGTGRLAIQAVYGLQSERTPRVLVGATDTELRSELRTELPNVAWLGELDRFAEIVVEQGIDEVCVALPVRSCFGEFERLYATTRELGIPVSFRVGLFSDSRRGLARLEGGWMIVDFNRHPATHSAMRAVKRALDLLITGGVLVLSAPLAVLIALAIKSTSRGPVLFRQPRVGSGRRIFQMLKFRTMVANAEALRRDLQSMNDARGISFKIFKDPRVTRIGRLLRRTSLDELPQLLNVIKGEMSLVGPRPLPVWVADQLDSAKYNRRFSVLPGITGLWQVKGRVQDFDRMAELDFDYVDRWSLRLDLKIIAATLPAMVRGENAV